MSLIAKMIRGVWCGITGSCPETPDPVDELDEDPYINWLKKEKQESEHRVQEQAPNRIEVAYLYGQLNGQEATKHGQHG